MIINAIEGCTRRLGKAQGYLGLPIRDIIHGPYGPAMQSSWQPTPAELAALVQGAPIILTIFGTGHPPVMLGTGSPPAPISSIGSQE